MAKNNRGKPILINCHFFLSCFVFTASSNLSFTSLDLESSTPLSSNRYSIEFNIKSLLPSYTFCSHTLYPMGSAVFVLRLILFFIKSASAITICLVGTLLDLNSIFNWSREAWNPGVIRLVYTDSNSPSSNLI